MKKLLLVFLAALVAGPMFAADLTPQLQDLVGKIRTKAQSGAKTEADYSDELKTFDSLLAEHKGEKTDDVAQILMLKALLYAQVLDEEPKAIEALKQMKSDFPDTAPGKRADEIMASLQKEEGAMKIRKSLVAGAKFPDFSVTGLDGKPLSVAGYKGKVLMIDFWATWCGPCVGELPNVLATYQKYHDKGLEIVGISLDKDKDALTSFIKEKGIPWRQYYDGKGWQNDLSTAYGVNSIPFTYLLDREGKIIGSDLRGDDLSAAVEKALAEK